MPDEIAFEMSNLKITVEEDCIIVFDDIPSYENNIDFSFDFEWESSDRKNL